MTTQIAIVTKIVDGWTKNHVGEIIFVSMKPTYDYKNAEVNYHVECHYYMYEPKSYTKGWKVDWEVIQGKLAKLL